LSELINIEPLAVEGVMDYHCHCDYSIDAAGTIEEYCHIALKRNLAEICFTTHFDSNPYSDGKDNFIRIKGEKVPATVENLEPYVEDVRKTAEKFYLEGLSVKLGLEIGWYEGCEEIVAKVQDRYDFDYLLCGIHEIDNICFCCHSSFEKYFSQYSATQAVEKYYRQVNFAAKTKLFNTIAHFEYYLKYGLGFYGEEILKAHKPFLEEIFQTLKETKTGLEINTSALRHGLNHYYPRMEIINAAKKAGVIVDYLGSDAHRPEQVGYDFEVAVALVPDTVHDTNG